MKNIFVSDDILNVGASDKKQDLFEGQYVLKNGMSYNSYLIKDEKNVLIDTVDEGVTEKWLKNLENALKNEKLDYLIVSHMEPDHAYNIGQLANKYPEMKIVGNQTTFNILLRFFEIDNIDDRKILVKEGEVLDIGRHKLQFFMAPMVHWPEVMVTYEQTEKILFAADAFGKFGSLEVHDNWIDEARRYYIGIVGKYGAQVQLLLNKATKLDIKTICSLHGPILNENLEYYLDKYNTWSSYKPEEEGVYIPCASIYGNSLDAAKKMKEILQEKGIKNVQVDDIDRCDWAEALANCFKYSHIIFVASSYNAGLFPPMLHLLERLKDRNYQNRKVGIIENGSWAPSAGKVMKSMLQEMKNINIVEPMITINSRLRDNDIEEMKKLADSLK